MILFGFDMHWGRRRFPSFIEKWCIFRCVFQYLVVGSPNSGARQQTPSYCPAEKQPHRILPYKKKHTSICKFEFPRVPYFHTKNINFKSVEYCRTKIWISKVYHTSIQKYHTSVQKYHTSVQKIILPYKNNFQSTSYTQILCKMCKILKY